MGAIRTFSLILALTLGPVLGAATAAQAQTWPCYDPQPGHPTPQERVAFVERVSPLAIEAERKHGVPAAAIVAMTIVESGYGFTRIALNANNFFGWKYTTPAAAGGRPEWVLTCQPPEDINNRYIQFASLADSIDFVASRLANSQYYRADTQRYRDDRNAGVEPRIAARRWVEGIADPYNWRPAEYVRTLVRLMNAPLNPSDTMDPARNLYALSAAVAPQGGAQPLQTVRQALTGFRYGRYMEGNCQAATVANWNGFPTQRCTYAMGGAAQRAEVVLLNPTDDQLARWITAACAAARTNDYAFCALKLARHIRGQSGGQFPVAGMVMEDMDGDGRPNQYAFRDGVTVSVAGVSQGKVGGPSAAENAAALEGPPLRAFRYARVAGTLREHYLAYVGARQAGNIEGLAWLAVVREAYQRAWGAEGNDLISAWAVANAASLRRP